MHVLGTGADLLARLERLVAATGGRSAIFVRSGGAYHRIDGWVQTETAMYLRCTPVYAADVDPAGLLDFDGD